MNSKVEKYGYPKLVVSSSALLAAADWHIPKVYTMKYADLYAYELQI